MKPRIGISRRRQTNGSQTAEFAVVLIFIFVILFFPMIDAATISYNWVCGYYLNFEELRQAVGFPQVSQAPSVVLGIQQQFQKSFGKYLQNVQSTLQAPVVLAGSDPTNPDYTITVVTTVQSLPFISVSGFNIPGFNLFTKPITFTFTSTRMLENPKDYNQ